MITIREVLKDEFGEWVTVDRDPTPEEEAQILADRDAAIPVQAQRRIYDGFNAALNAPVIYSGATFDNRSDSRADLNGVLTNVLNGVTLPAGFAWRDSSNVDHPFTVDDLKALAGLMLANQWRAHQRKRELIAQFESATTTEDYEAIQW